jgi:hypothetical protein
MDNDQRKTLQAFIWTNALKAPFWALYGLLVFILYKDLKASNFQLALFIALKPIVSVFSVYWSHIVVNRKDLLIPNIIIGTFIGYTPFFFFPFFRNPWFFIFAGALYLMFMRGIIPAWMEILKINLPSVSREMAVSYGSAISYLGGVIFPLFLGDFLDVYPGIWEWLFPATAVLGLGSVFFQLRIPILRCDCSKIFIDKTSTDQKQDRKRKRFDCICHPWRVAWRLFKEREDFRQFQIGFFLGGMGLMLIQPALPHFFFDGIHLSYTELAVALSVCKGLGFIVTTRWWTILLTKVNIFKFSAIVTLFGACFPLCLLLAKHHIFWLYFAYLSYGVMQAGSELSWHLSGPIFAKVEDSSSFSSVNVAMVGLRGCVAPFLGSVLCSNFSAVIVLCFSAMFCLLATIYMRYCNEKIISLPYLSS